jgi:hypothetical protein
MLFLATRSTSIASSAGMVTLSGGWTMTFEYVPLRDFSCPYDIKRTSLVHFAARKRIPHPTRKAPVTDAGNGRSALARVLQ